MHIVCLSNGKTDICWSFLNASLCLFHYNDAVVSTLSYSNNVISITLAKFY